MAQYITIQVTQQDIDKALRNKSSRCVLATALARTIPNAKHVSVDLQTVRFTVDGERRIYLTPPATVGYVIAFDAGDEIHPFAFRLSERHQVKARNDRHTPAGAARARARTNERSAKESLARAETQQAELPSDPDPVAAAVAEHAVKEAKQKVLRRKRERKAVEAEHAGQPHWEPDTTPDERTAERKVKPPPQAFKYGTRAYGHRDLRINQDEPTPENMAARRAVMGVYDEYSDEPDLV